MNKKIAIIGLGYVGLPLSRLFAMKYSVVGFDINKTRVEELNKSIDVTKEVDSEELLSIILSEKTEEKGLFCISQVNTMLKTVPFL
ncbi:hypothetical protein MHM83_11765 [Tenacibaculum sp. Mcav3-52]|uniref:hypothetical protein n=1 Tax=Tenacibaculum sp. Mcav3-52 TaxID=2917762 RepID=UPI001EF2C26F|nr:hypothetical protein [Tenacibaculum sp. Mcav3-52]